MSDNCDEVAWKAAVAMTERSTALETFMRASNMLTKLLEKESTSENVLREQFNKFLDCWDKLEEAHGEYLEIAEVEEDEYLKDPEEIMEAEYMRYNDRLIELKKKEQEIKDTMAATERTAAEASRKKDVAERMEAEKVKFLGDAESFKDLARILEEKVGTEIGADRKRRELGMLQEMLEKEFARLRMWKIELIGLDPAGNHEDFKNAFTKDVGKVFEVVQKRILVEVKGVPISSIVHSGGAAACSEKGHIRRDFIESGRDRKTKRSDNRRPPEHKRFWCALHKGDKTKRCWSNSCQELKMTDNATRVELLKENRDCVYCCGDHPSERCEWKLRKCGGGNVNRGCGEDHNVHEMHCPDARCYSIQIGPAESKVKKEEGKEMEEKPGEDLEADCLHAGGNETLLQVMRVKGQKGGTNTSVFFDPGSTSGFVREKYAEQQGFKGRKMRLGVTTLSGEKKEYDGKLYTCYIRDTDGQLHEFQAYGLEVITGPLSRIDMHRVEKLFPNMSKSQLMDLNRPNQVDILIGMDHASWHPQRVEKAVDVEGDLWIYRGMFGSCLGGRHPLVREASRRSDSLFVNVEKVGMEVSMQEVGRDCEDDGAQVVSGKGESDLGDKVREEESDSDNGGGGEVDDKGKGNENDDKSDEIGQIGDEDEERFELMGEAQEDQLGSGFGGGPVGGGRRGGRRLGGVMGALVLVVVAVLLLAAGVTEDPSTATGALVLVVVVLLVVAGEVVVREVSEENGDKT